MGIKTTVTVGLALLAAGCASAPPDYAKTPPAPGADIYRCVNSEGRAQFVRVKPGSHEMWRGDKWGADDCANPSNTCKTDDEGFVVVETVSSISMSTGPVRVDTIRIYNLNAGTVLFTAAIAGTPMSPSRSTCALHS